MRKVTEKTAQAFYEGRATKSGNTKVLGNYQNTILTLHDNVIATIERSGINSSKADKLVLTDSGWQTVTTKERLNGVLSRFFGNKYRIAQERGEWLFKTFDEDGLIMRDELWHGIKELEV